MIIILITSILVSILWALAILSIEPSHWFTKLLQVVILGVMLFYAVLVTNLITFML